MADSFGELGKIIHILFRLQRLLLFGRRRARHVDIVSKLIGWQSANKHEKVRANKHFWAR